MLTIIRQTLLLIEKNDRTRFFGVVVLGLFTTALDTMGILSVFPFLQLATKPEIVQSNSYLRTVFQFFHFSSVQNFLILVGIAMLFFFSLANAIKGFSLWYSNIFIYRCNQKISVKLLSLYFRENYLLNIKKNSAEVATQLLSYVDLGMSSMLHAILGLISSVLLVLSLLSILFYTQPYSALIMFLSVGVLYFILDKSIKFQLVELGQKSMSNSKNLYKSINESTGGVKEIKYLNRAHKFLEDYNQIYGHYVDLKSKSNVLQFLPKLIIDSLAFASGILMIILMIMNGSQLSDCLPLLFYDWSQMHRSSCSRLLKSATPKNLFNF